MHKNQLNLELTNITQSLQGAIWLLNHCNHSSHPTGYAHHVRDRISDSLVNELANTIATIERLKSHVNSGIDNEG